MPPLLYNGLFHLTAHVRKWLRKIAARQTEWREWSHRTETWRQREETWNYRRWRAFSRRPLVMTSSVNSKKTLALLVLALLVLALAVLALAVLTASSCPLLSVWARVTSAGLPLPAGGDCQHGADTDQYSHLYFSYSTDTDQYSHLYLSKAVIPHCVHCVWSAAYKTFVK